MKVAQSESLSMRMGTAKIHSGMEEQVIEPGMGRRVSEAFGSPSQEVAVSGCVKGQGGAWEARQLLSNTKPWGRGRLGGG